MSLGESDSNAGFRQHLLDLVDRSGLSDCRLSLLATGSTKTVRRLRRGSMPRLDTLEALCRALGVRIRVAPLDEGGQPPETPPLWSRQFRKDIRRDIAEIFGRTRKRPPRSNRPGQDRRGQKRMSRGPRSHGTGDRPSWGNRGSVSTPRAD